MDINDPEVKRLMAERDEMIRRNAMLRQRPDLPADRIPAADRYERLLKKKDAVIADLKSQLERVIECGTDQKGQAPVCQLFVATFGENGECVHCGEVISETDSHFRIEVCDAFMLVGGGMWQLSGEIKDVPKGICRIFSDKIACMEVCHRVNSKLRGG